MKRRDLIWIGIAAGGVYLVTRSRKCAYQPDELRNVLWDDEKRRWRTDAEVIEYLREHPERVIACLTSIESSVLSYITEIDAASQKFLLEQGLISAIIDVESRGDWTARGAVGEYGLMQLRGSTAQMMGYTGDWDDLLNPSLNIWYGTMYLRHQMDRYEAYTEQVEYAVSAYNAGTAYMKGSQFVNQNYVDRVMRRWPRYTWLINRAKGVYGPPAP